MRSIRGGDIFLSFKTYILNLGRSNNIPFYEILNDSEHLYTTSNPITSGNIRDPFYGKRFEVGTLPAYFFLREYFCLHVKKEPNKIQVEAMSKFNYILLWSWSQNRNPSRLPHTLFCYWYFFGLYVIPDISGIFLHKKSPFLRTKPRLGDIDFSWSLDPRGWDPHFVVQTYTWNWSVFALKIRFGHQHRNERIKSLLRPTPYSLPTENLQ